MSLQYYYREKTVQELVLLFDSELLNLEPGFQRKSVWSIKDRKKLIATLIQNYPIPSIFLYLRETEDGKQEYVVVDGKQRIESILKFQGLGWFKRDRFSLMTKINANDKVEEWNWKRMQQKRVNGLLLKYKIPVVEVSGDFSDIIELFVLINSTGKKLAKQELLNAKFYDSEFLKEVGKLVNRHESYFLENRILSRGQIERMKHIELVCELVASLGPAGVINKKKSLDAIIGGHSIGGRQLQKHIQEFTTTLNRVKKIFPNLRSTRFANAVDFYSLFLLVWEMEKQHCILTDPRRNRQAEKLLIWLSQGVDQVRQQNRKIEGIKSEQRLFADYLLTIQGDTDSAATRQRRAEILRQVLGGLFMKKDAQRHFTREQRRLIWHSDDNKRCVECNELLTWENFTIDHVKPHARGGRTNAANAALLCRKHNSSLGAK